MSEPAAGAPALPRKRSRRIAAAIVAGLLVLSLLGLVAASMSPTVRWGVQAMLAPPSDADAWTFVPGGRPIVAALDVQSMLASPLARELRPELVAVARGEGLDLTLAEKNARLIVVASDGRGFAHGAAAGPRLSPLLLPRFDAHWSVVGTRRGPAVTDGSAVILPLTPGLVAFTVSEGGHDAGPALEAGLDAASRASQPPLPLDGAALRIVVEPDEPLRRRMMLSVPRAAASYVASVKRLEAEAEATDALHAEVRVSMVSEDAAIATGAALEQLRQILATGLVAFLVPFVGEDAAMLGKLPPFTASRDGADVIVTMTASAEQVRGLLQELQAAQARRAR